MRILLQKLFQIHCHRFGNIARILFCTAVGIALEGTFQDVKASRIPDLLWSVPYNGVQSSVGAIGVDSGGNVIVGAQGVVLHREESKSFFSKLNSSGVKLWEKEFLAQFISGTVIDDDDNIFLAGSYFRGPWIGKFSPDGTELWNKVTVDRGLSSSIGLVRDSQGSFYTTGTTFEQVGPAEFTDRNIMLQKISPVGELSWFREFGTDETEWGTDLAIDANDNVYVTGRTLPYVSESGEDIDAASILSKFDSEGNELWRRIIEGDGNVYSSDLAVDSSGNVFLGGTTAAQLGDSSLGGDDAFVSRWDTNGNLIWTKQFGTSGGDEVNALQVSGDGFLYVGGVTDSRFPNVSFNERGFTSLWNYEGEVQWSYNPSEDSEIHAVNEFVFDDAGNLYTNSRVGDTRFFPPSVVSKLTLVPEPSTATMVWAVMLLLSTTRKKVS